MERAQHTTSVWIATFDDWLVKAGKIAAGETLWVHDGRGLHYSDAQAALDAQYGKCAFAAGNHGKALFAKRYHIIPKDQTNEPG